MKTIRKSFVITILASALALSPIFPVTACEGDLPFSNGQHSEITVVKTVDYNEFDGTYYFITEGETEFWVLDIKKEPFSPQKLAMYKKMYEGNKVQVNFVVQDNSIIQMTHQLLPQAPTPKK